MGYSMSLHLKKDAPADLIESMLKESVFLANNGSIYISQIAKEHGYSVPYDKGLYISYSTTTEPESYFIHGFFKMVAKLYGETTINPMDQKFYPFYNYDDEITLIIEESVFLENPKNYKDFYAENGVVVDADYVEDVYEAMDAKAYEDIENGEKFEDTITPNIKNYSFDYIKSSVPKKDMSFSLFLVDLLTDQQKTLEEVFKNLKEIEQELVSNKKTS
jgi:6-pyruvoyl-tetrahydropterin synthase